MNLSTLLIREDYNVQVATLEVAGRKGAVTIKQTATQCRTDVASVVVKLDGEKEVKQNINTRIDIDGIREYLSDFYLNVEFVTSWSI